jgi:DMSO reductase anchor subunit
MRARRGSVAWPLVVFTVLTQAAAGTCLARVLLCMASREPDQLDPLLPVALAMLIVGALSAVLHLGRPREARLVLANLRSSWLSRESALGVAFGAGIAAVFAMRRMDFGTPATRACLEVAVVLCGLGLVFAISRLYRLRTVPAWDTWATPAAFFGTALVLGMALAALNQLQAGVSTGTLSRALHGLSIVAVMLAAGQLVVTLIHVNDLRRQGGAAAASAAIITADLRPVLALRVIATVSGAALLPIATWPYGRQDPKVALAAFALLLVGEILGRYIFYASHRRVGL